MAGRILVPGSGVGHDARMLGERYPDAQVDGWDIADAAVSRANGWGNPPNVAFKRRDFLAFEGDETFAWVVEHTCFCAIDPALRPSYVAAAHGLLHAGGFLLGVFFLEENPDTSGPPYFCSPSDLEGYFSTMFELLERVVPSCSFPGREGEEEVWLWRKRA